MVCDAGLGQTPAVSELRDELVEHIRQNRALWMAGTGVALMASGKAPVAGWKGLIQHGLTHAKDINHLSDAWLRRQLEALDDPPDAVELIQIATQVEQRLKQGDWAGWLRQTVGSLKVNHSAVVEKLHLLGQGHRSPLLLLASSTLFVCISQV